MRTSSSWLLIIGLFGRLRAPVGATTIEHNALAGELTMNIKAGAAILLTALAFLLSNQANAADINTVITYCVGIARNTPDNSGNYNNPIIRNFDAFYNPVTGNVENNGTSVALFQFDKCMTQQGFPLRNIK
ncbi:MAG TPA: hypothetical protein VIJ42_00335 [Stellaceae bacterium]